MLGPVFGLEMQRQWRHGWAARLIPWGCAIFFGLQLLAVLFEFALVGTDILPPTTLLTMKLNGLVLQHFFVVFLLTPALTAPALSEDKAKGLLSDLFTTALTSTEIVRDKLLARAAQALEVILAGLPIVCTVVAVIGVPPIFCIALLFLTLLIVLNVSALGLLASVWSKYASGAVLATYAVLGAGAFAVARVPLPALDPFWTLAPCWSEGNAGEIAWRLLQAGLAWGTLALVFFALAVWRLRPACVRQMEGRGLRRGAPAPRRPPVTDDPIRWKEYHIEGLALLPFLRRVPRWMGVFGAGWLACAATWMTAVFSRARVPGGINPVPYISQALIFLAAITLIVTVRSAAAVTAEREGQTWDSLRLTGLDFEQFLDGKLRGILAAIVPYYCAYAVPAILLAVSGDMATFLVTLTSLVMAWPVMYHAATNGLRASVFGRSTWRSIAVALLAVYGVQIVACFGLPLVTILTCFCVFGVFGSSEEAFVTNVLLAVIVPSTCVLVAAGRANFRKAASVGFNSPPELPLSLNTHDGERRPEGGR